MTDPTTFFEFEFEPRMAVPAALFGVHPRNCVVALDGKALTARFGTWSIRTALTNIAGARATGPYRWWRVAGPAHLSLADRGVTFATTTRHGICVDLHEPIAAIAPLRWPTHPSVTLTVTDPQRFLDALEDRGVPTSAPTDGVVESGRGSWVGSAAAVLEWCSRRGSVRAVQRTVDEVSPPPGFESRADDAQDIDDGVGATFHRTYEVRVERPRLDAEALMAAIATDPNLIVPQELSPFLKQRGDVGSPAVGDRFLIDARGPWQASVEVTSLTARAIRFATLDGHMEAGQIQFDARDDLGAVVFRIESWARSADRTFDLLYDIAGVGRALQSETWVRTCEAIAVAAGGEQDGPVLLVEERA